MVNPGKPQDGKGRLQLRDIRVGWSGFARGGYGNAFHSVVLDSGFLFKKCGGTIEITDKRLVLLEHPPYNGTWCRKCERR